MTDHKQSNHSSSLEAPRTPDCLPEGLSSSLDAKESTLHSRDYSSFRAFLLSGLGDKPQAVRELFSDLDQRDGTHRLDTWCQCRTSAWFVRHRDSGEVRVASSRCHMRWCPLCEIADRFATTENVSRRLKFAYQPKFITLTLNHSNRALADQIKDLYGAFVRLRRQKRWKRTISGGVWFFQITMNEETKQWHNHLHVLIEGGYYDQDHLSRDWKKASKGSYIVDIRAVRDRGYTAGYVARYATSPCNMAKLSRVDRVTLFDALYHRKIKGTFGTWSDVKLTAEPPDDAGKWDFLCGYWETYNFRHRDDWLAEIWEAWILKRECSAIPKELEPDTRPPPELTEEPYTHEQMLLFRP